MKFENTDVYNFENAIRGMRNPMNSWNKSDSGFGCDGELCSICMFKPDGCNTTPEFILGENDLDLAQRLIKGGSEHGKWLRQVFISVDITAPLFWWKECDTYKVGTTANSTSTMHKLSTTPITIDCFETDDMDDSVALVGIANTFIEDLEKCRLKYLETKDKKYWKELVRWLPESWLQTRTWTANYEVIRNIVHQRQGHKLTEWASFIEWAKSLPYAEELIFYEG